MSYQQPNNESCHAGDSLPIFSTLGRGPKGEDGVSNIAGPQGEKGEPGDTGPQGLPGAALSVFYYEEVPE